MRIGYQGAEGSNAERAARIIAQESDTGDAELIGLVGSGQVVAALASGEVDLGVVAVRNSIGGAVCETDEALYRIDAEVLATTEIAIRHNLYKLPDIPVEWLRTVASHEQALAQTRQTRARRWVRLAESETPDAAIAAKWLAEGRFLPDVAVICGETAGEAYGLELVDADIQDVDSRTEFQLIRLAGDEA